MTATQRDVSCMMTGMGEWLEKFLVAWIPLFVAIDVMGLVPLFLGITAGEPREKVDLITRQAMWTSCLVAIGFMLLGKFVFRALGITVADFQVAGGLVLLVLAVRDLVISDNGKILLADDFGVVPLGMPMIAGPATLATVLVLQESVGPLATIAALATNLVLVFVAFKSSAWLKKAMGVTAMKAISKIVTLLLAAIAVHLIRMGWQGS
jgi:multiple antibiotic resistance protein